MSDVAVKSDLSAPERVRLSSLETIITKWFNDSRKVSTALREISDKKLYRATHKTFPEYCREVWALSETHVNRIIAAENVRGVLETTPMGVVSAPTERVARELAPLKDEPKKMIQAWTQAVETHGTPTAAQVRAIVRHEPEEIIEDAEIIEPPALGPIIRGPYAKRIGTRSETTISAVGRAFNAARDDGWTLAEITDTIEQAHRERVA